MPVRKPRRRKAVGSVVTSGVGTKKNSGVARRAGRGKLGGGVLKATPTKRAGKPTGGPSAGPTPRPPRGPYKPSPNLPRIGGPTPSKPKLYVSPTKKKKKKKSK